MKEFSKWPTFPQVFVKGELVGGLDIVKELEASSELAQTLPVRKADDLTSRLKAVCVFFFLFQFFKDMMNLMGYFLSLS